MILQCDDRRPRAGQARRRATKVSNYLADASRACEAFHDKTVRGVRSKRVQCDEIWSFVYAKQRNVPTAKAAPRDAGDIWTWTAIDAEHKLIISYLVGSRDASNGLVFMKEQMRRSTRLTNAMAAGLSQTLWSMDDIVKLIDDAAESPKARGSYKPRQPKAGTISK